jgi:hypothetical protein
MAEISAPDDAPRILLLAGPAASRTGLEAARVQSLWRGLCQCGETWRIDLDPPAETAVDLPRHRHATSGDLPGLIGPLLRETGAGVVVLAAGATLDAVLLPPGLRVIGLPDPDGNLPPAASEIWLRDRATTAALANEERPVKIIADSFEPPVSPRPAPAPGTVAVIGAHDSISAAVLAPLANGSYRVIGTQQNYKAIAALHAGPVARADNIAAALEAAGACILAGPEAAMAPLRTWAALHDRVLLWPASGDDAGDDAGNGQDEPELSHLDPLAALRDIAAALGVTLPVDPAEIGARVGRNLGLEITVAMATFHPRVRLLHVIYDIQGDVPANCLGGRIRQRTITGGAAASTEGLVNAWVRDAGALPGIPARQRAAAALAADVDVDDILIDIDAWGWPVGERTALESLKTEEGGLISLELESRARARVAYWSRHPGTPVQMGRKLIHTAPVRHDPDGLALFRATEDFPFNRDSLTVLPPGGLGQKFGHFHLFNENRRVSSHRLESMRDSLAGRTAWLIGNGPSVRLDDLDQLADAGTICFGFNRFHLAHDSTRLRPDFTVTGDRQMIEDFGQDIVDKSGGTVFVADEKPPNLLGDYAWVRQISVFPSLFSHDAARAVTPGGSSVYVALQIGHYLGIRHWYIYGADFGFKFSQPRLGTSDFRTATGDGNHFIPNYRGGRPWCPPAIENILPSFYAARLMMELDGGFIRNATRGGHLEVFERIDFATALEQSRAGREAHDPSDKIETLK